MPARKVACSNLNVPPNLFAASKPAVQLNIGEVGVWTVWKDISDNSFAGSMRYVEGECRLRVELVVSTQIKDSCESFMAAGRTSGISKRLFLERPTTAVPKVLCGR